MLWVWLSPIGVLGPTSMIPPMKHQVPRHTNGKVEVCATCSPVVFTVSLGLLFLSIPRRRTAVLTVSSRGRKCIITAVCAVIIWRSLICVWVCEWRRERGRSMIYLMMKSFSSWQLRLVRNFYLANVSTRFSSSPQGNKTWSWDLNLRLCWGLWVCAIATYNCQC